MASPTPQQVEQAKAELAAVAANRRSSCDWRRPRSAAHGRSYGDKRCSNEAARSVAGRPRDVVL